MEPILKWPGGKTQLLTELSEIINIDKIGNGTYYEPFIGGGAVAFNLAPNKLVVNDLNPELVNVYQIVKDSPEALIQALEEFKQNHSTEQYYKVRAWDRLENYKDLPNIVKAARIIYLNKTCFNGLYRVNSKGQFNSPIGRSSSGKLPDIVCADRIRAISNYLNSNNVKIMNTNYLTVLQDAKQGDFIYLDPPYDYESGNGFVAYQKEGWNHADLIELKAACDELVKRGCNVVISNNDTSFVRELFADYNMKEVKARRSISCKSENRANANELIIYKVN